MDIIFLKTKTKTKEAPQNANEANRIGGTRSLYYESHICTFPLLLLLLYSRKNQTNQPIPVSTAFPSPNLFPINTLSLHNIYTYIYI